MRRGSSSTEDGFPIRSATPDDAAGVLAIYAPIVTGTVVSFEETPPDEQEMRRRIAASHAWLVADDEAGVAGYAYAAPFHERAAYRWSVEVSVYLAERARGRGLGRSLVAELLAQLTARGFVNVFAGVALPNDASVALFESFGFVKIAHQRQAGFKMGAWHDVGWWQLELQGSPVPPPVIEGL